MNNDVRQLRIKNKVFTYNETHFSQHPTVLENMAEALEKVISELDSQKNGSFIKKTVDLGKVIGKREAIELKGDEEIFYAQRLGRKTLTKFVRGVKPEDCSAITFIVSKVNEQHYRFITAYIGYSAEKEPLDPAIKTEEEFNRAKKYWNKTAMIEGMQAIYPNTITKDCPWDKIDNRFNTNINDKDNVQDRINQIRLSEQSRTDNKYKP